MVQKLDEETTVLKRADLEKLEGVWQLKAEPKEGWQGTVRATISFYPADSKLADFGKIQFSGLMAPLITRSIPDLQPSFVEFAAALKQRVENGAA